jgi:hypothetical protein
MITGHIICYRHPFFPFFINMHIGMAEKPSAAGFLCRNILDDPVSGVLPVWSPKYGRITNPLDIWF